MSPERRATPRITGALVQRHHALQTNVHGKWIATGRPIPLGLFEHRCLFHIGQQVDQKGPTGQPGRRGGKQRDARWIHLPRGLVRLRRQCDLSQRIAASQTLRRRPSVLHRGNRHRQQQTYDRDHDQQFDQGKAPHTTPAFRSCVPEFHHTSSLLPRRVLCHNLTFGIGVTKH